MNIVTSVSYKDWPPKSKLACMPIAAASFCTMQPSTCSSFRLFLLLAFRFYKNSYIHTYSYENINRQHSFKYCLELSSTIHVFFKKYFYSHTQLNLYFIWARFLDLFKMRPYSNFLYLFNAQVINNNTNKLSLCA